MPTVRRTKAQKVKAQIKHSNAGMTYSFSTPSSRTSDTPSGAKLSQTARATTVSMADLFSYDINLIYRDLFKTVVLTILMFAVLIGLSFII